jgi:hypothetical protein
LNLKKLPMTVYVLAAVLIMLNVYELMLDATAVGAVPFDQRIVVATPSICIPDKLKAVVPVWYRKVTVNARPIGISELSVVVELPRMFSVNAAVAFTV